MSKIEYVSIDIETTGLDHEVCKIIQFGAVVDDLISPIDSLPKFETLVLQRSQIYPLSLYVMQMNTDLITQISEIEKNKDNRMGWCFEDQLSNKFRLFLHGQAGWDFKTKLTVAGKNFAGFDLRFLEKIMSWDTIPLHHRVIDPATMYWNPAIDSELPNTETCKKRAGIEGPVAHTALQDALDVVKLIRGCHAS